jgi:hypothetical protein
MAPLEARMKASSHPHISKSPAKTGAAKTGAAKPRASAPRSGRVSKVTAQTATVRNDEERRTLIALAAYFRAERRGFTPGQELDDWLAAESEIDGQSLLAHQLGHSDT